MGGELDGGGCVVLTEHDGQVDEEEEEVDEVAFAGEEGHGGAVSDRRSPSRKFVLGWWIVCGALSPLSMTAGSRVLSLAERYDARAL